jgi:hypothetical protein
MAMHSLPPKETSIYYYLDIESKKVRKLKEYHKKINYNNVYYGTKSNAIKKLNKLLSI